MKISRGELQKFNRTVEPAHAPIEPVLSAAEEARLIVDGKDPTAVKRRQRVVALLQRAAAPEGADAELIALLALAKALPLDGKDDRLEARMRLSEIGRMKEPPPGVREVQARLRVEPGDGQAFAEKLLPAGRDIGGFTESGVGFVGT